MFADRPGKDKLEYIGPLMKNCVKAVLPKTADKAKSLAEYAAEFAKMLYSNPDERAETVGVDQDAEKDSKSTAIMYDDAGVPMEVGKATLMNKGFKIDKFVLLQKSKKANEQWQILDISGEGTVTPAKVDPSGSVTADTAQHCQVELAAFLEKYKTAK